MREDGHDQIPVVVALAAVVVVGIGDCSGWCCGGRWWRAEGARTHVGGGGGVGE